MKQRSSSHIHDTTKDPTIRAASELDTAMGTAHVDEDTIAIIDPHIKEREDARAEEQTVQRKAKQLPITDVLSGSAVFTGASNRESVRVLLITERKGLEMGGVTEPDIDELASLFSEVHVLALNHDVGAATARTFRRAANTWVYPVHPPSLFSLWNESARVVEEQLVFSGGFRPDIVIADGPVWAGYVGERISKKYGRPFQIHVRRDFYADLEREAGLAGWVTRYLVRQRVRNAPCILAHSSTLEQLLLTNEPGLAGKVYLKPTYYNLAGWQKTPITTNLRELFSSFTFFMTHVTHGSLRAHSDRVLDGCAPVLRRYPTACLVVVCPKEGSDVLKKRAQALGVKNQVLFLYDFSQCLSYLKTTDLYLQLSEQPVDIEWVLMAASVGTPIITHPTGFLRELLSDGESASMCPSDSPSCVSNKLAELMSHTEMRRRLGTSAQTAAFARIPQDYGVYLAAYRQQIEQCGV